MLERRITLISKETPCPRCGMISPQHSIQTREVEDLGPIKPVLKISCHRCPGCGKFSLAYDKDVVAPGSRYTKKVKDKVLELRREEGLSADKIVSRMIIEHSVHVTRSVVYRWINEMEK